MAHTPASRMVRGLGIQTAVTVMPPDTKGSVPPLAQGVSVQAVLQLIIALRVSRCLFLSFDCVSFGVLCSARVSSGASCVG